MTFEIFSSLKAKFFEILSEFQLKKLLDSSFSRFITQFYQENQQHGLFSIASLLIPIMHLAGRTTNRTEIVRKNTNISVTSVESRLRETALLNLRMFDAYQMQPPAELRRNAKKPDRSFLFWFFIAKISDRIC